MAMGNESGTWIMYGVDWDDPECLRTVEDAIDYIDEMGFFLYLRMKSQDFLWKRER